jgi:HD-GYP domain-containing protein (c-di-GMP phosphodiesterase class II)
MTSDRIYRKGVTPFEALQVIRSLEPRQLDTTIVDVFFSRVAPYPPGCKVKLDTGEIGIVVTTRGEASLVVQVEYDALGCPLRKPTVVDLGRYAARRIARML